MTPNSVAEKQPEQPAELRELFYAAGGILRFADVVDGNELRLFVNGNFLADLREALTAARSIAWAPRAEAGGQAAPSRADEGWGDPNKTMRDQPAAPGLEAERDSLRDQLAAAQGLARDWSDLAREIAYVSTSVQLRSLQERVIAMSARTSEREYVRQLEAERDSLRDQLAAAQSECKRLRSNPMSIPQFPAGAARTSERGEGGRDACVLTVVEMKGENANNR